MQGNAIKTACGVLVTLLWYLALQGETDPKDYFREVSAWAGGFLIGGGLLSADEFFRKLWYKKD